MTTTNATKARAKGLPVFNLTRCKRCGICSHFCPKKCIGIHEDDTPYLAEPDACTSCRMCEYMCPDWAVCLDAPHTGEGDTEAG